MKENINKICENIYQANKAKGFWEDREDLDKKYSGNELEFVKKASKAQMLALIHSEISEALEADRKNLMDNKLSHRTGLEVELADAVIRIFDMAGGLGIDLGGAIEEKLNYNTTRPYKHGKSY